MSELLRDLWYFAALSRELKPGRLQRKLLLGEPFGPEEALDFGLVSYVAPAGQLDVALARLVAALRAKPAEALRLTQRLLRRGQTDEVLERMELENGHFSERLTSNEVKEAITAFFAARSQGQKAAE